MKLGGASDVVAVLDDTRLVSVYYSIKTVNGLQIICRRGSPSQRLRRDPRLIITLKRCMKVEQANAKQTKTTA